MNRVLSVTDKTASEKIATATKSARIAEASAKQWQNKYNERADELASLQARTAAAEAARDAALASVSPIKTKLYKLQEIGERVHGMLIGRIVTMGELSREFDALPSVERQSERGEKLKKGMADAQGLLVFGWERMEGEYRLLTENGGFWRNVGMDMKMESEGKQGEADDGISVEDEGEVRGNAIAGGKS